MVRPNPLPPVARRRTRPPPPESLKPVRQVLRRHARLVVGHGYSHLLPMEIRSLEAKVG